MITYRCKDSQDRYYVGAPHKMTKRERLQRRNWQTADELVGRCVHGKWVHPDVPRMVAEQVGARVVRCFDREESRARAEARGEVRALEAVLAKSHAIAGWGPGEFDAMLTDARTRAGLREGGRR